MTKNYRNTTDGLTVKKKKHKSNLIANLLQEIRDNIRGVNLGGVSTKIEGGSGGSDPDLHDSWMESTSFWLDP